MKKLILSVIILCLAGQACLFAQSYKVTERSDKKAPAWYESTQAGYIVASAEAATLEEARQMCLASIKRQIIQSIAENIEFSDSHTIKQTQRNDHISEFLDVYTAEGSTQAASMPFIKGISLSKADGSYWEKRQDKKSKEITCCYAVRYPFPVSEHKALIAEFEQRDREMENLVEGLEKDIDSVESIEEINQRINKLLPAAEYFFDKTRQQWVNSVIANYKKLPTFVTVEGKASDGKTYVLSLFLKGKKITTATMPKLTSNCASKLQASPRDSDILISYEDEDCLKDEQNSVEAVFRLQGRVLKHTFYIN